MYLEFAAVLVFIFVGSAFVAGGLILGSFLRQKTKEKQKRLTYECGEPTIGSSWIRFNNRFYNIALIYLLFDVEVVLLLPVLLVLKETSLSGEGFLAFVLILVFLFFLTLGLVYEWFYGNLNWIRSSDY